MKTILKLITGRNKCKHEFSGYGGGLPYLRLARKGIIDGIDREHLEITGCCDKCDQIVQVAIVHKPKEFSKTALELHIKNLLDTADQEGCTPDLSVVDSGLLRVLAEAVGHRWENTCINHLDSCDGDGFCNECGYQ